MELGLTNITELLNGQRKLLKFCWRQNQFLIIHEKN